MSTPPESSGRRSGLALHVGFNGLAQVAPLVVMLAITPLLLDRLGLDRFGVWSLALVILGTLIALDGGVSASLARFFASYAAHGDRAGAGRLFVGAVLFFAFFGTVVTLAAYPAAPAIVELFDVPGALEDEAVYVLRWLPALTALALAASSASALLQGNGRFRGLVVVMLSASGTFALAVVVLVDSDAHLRSVMLATACRYAVQLVVGVSAAAGTISLAWPFLPSLATVRDLWGYASRMQLSAATGFVNSELDALVIAAVLPVRYVGLYSIGLQAAAAARSLPLYAFPPVLTRLTGTFRREGRRAAGAEFARLERTWLPAVLAYGLVAVAAVGFSIPVWLGDRYVLSGAVAVILLACFTVHVALTGMRTCYVRAVGRPGLETRCSALWTLVNAVLTVPLALVAGVIGVVSATAIAGIVASMYFVLLCRRTEGLPGAVPQPRWWALAAVAATLTVAGELAIVRTGLHGFLPLALTALPPLVGLSVFAVGFRRSLRFAI